MPKRAPILAIETSCDECSAAVVGRTSGEPARAAVLSNIVFSQIDLHRRFGGVVPEVASRSHLDMLAPVVDEALEKAGLKFNDLEGIAVTQGPGLIGALLVGVSAAKAMAYAMKKPLIPVNHLDGHLHSIFIDGQASCADISEKHLPLLMCLVSGGHTNLYLIRNLPPESLQAKKLSESRDDAAGEAFDKTAKLLGLPYPGGLHLDRLAKNGDREKFEFPMPLMGKEDLEFSFSGLKTAVSTHLKKQGFDSKQSFPKDQLLHDYCASIQETIVKILLRKIKIALRQTKAKSLAVVGGVSANSRFRELLSKEIQVPVLFPSMEYCTDNAAMIGACGLFRFERNEFLTGDALLAMNAYSSQEQVSMS